MYKTMDNDTITVGELGVRFLVEAADSNGSASVFECHVPANSRMPAPHSHDGFEETIYGLKGTTTWTIDGETVDVGPGEAVCVRRGQIHGFENRGDIDATFLAIATPAVFGPAYFREIAEVLAASAGGPPDLAAIGEVMRRHGLTPAPPRRSISTRRSNPDEDRRLRSDGHDRHSHSGRARAARPRRDGPVAATAPSPQATVRQPRGGRTPGSGSRVSARPYACPLGRWRLCADGE